MEDKKITLIVGDQEKEFNVLFTYHHDERNADFIFIYDEESPEDVMLFQYYEDQTLEQVEDEEILAEAQEILDAYDEENLGEVEVPEV